MPLSEQEKRTLDQIEEGLRRSDPKLERLIGSERPRRRVLATNKLGVALVVVGLLLMVRLLFEHYLAAFGGFLVMAVGAAILERNFRHRREIRLPRNKNETHPAFGDHSEPQ